MKTTDQFKSRLKAYFVKQLGAYDYRHGWMRVPVCPYCGRENKLGVNLSAYRTNCFRCNAHPSPVQLIMDIEGFSEYSQLYSFLTLDKFEGFAFTETKAEIQESIPVYLPDGFTNISMGNSQLARSIRGYAKKRGFNIEQLSKQGIGYCTRGDLYGYLVIPFYYHGKLRYYNARNVMGSGPRYNNPDKDITGVGKQFIIFNHDALETYKSTYICEGALNALTMGDRGIATMGKAISRYQLNELLKAPCERYIIMLDYDAIDYAIDLALKLAPFKRVKLIQFKDDRDVNDLGVKETLKLVHDTRYQSYQELIAIRNSL